MSARSSRDAARQAETMAEKAPHTAEGSADRQGRRRWRRYLPVVALIVASALAFAFDLHHLLSFETLQQHDRTLREAVADQPFLMAVGYTVAYALVVATALPAAVLMTVVGGYFFGIWLGGSLAVAGATMGAVGVFLVAGTSFGRRLGAGTSPLLERMRAGFQKDAFSYLFILRLLPILPFLVASVVPALLGVSLQVFTAATVLGMIPGSFVYASVGNGLGAIIARGDEPDLDILLEPEILGPLLGLAALALLPVIYKRLKGSRDDVP
jgi:uncharacterized membrane protein YdjX (TVP38/TMEM64 family)